MEENNLNRERESESIDIKVLVEKFYHPLALVCGVGAFVFGHRFVDMPEPSAYLQRDG